MSSPADNGEEVFDYSWLCPFTAEQIVEIGALQEHDDVRKMVATADPRTATDIERTWRLMKRYHVSDADTLLGQLRLKALVGVDKAVEEQMPALEEALDENILELMRQFSAEARALVDDTDAVTAEGAGGDSGDGETETKGASDAGAAPPPPQVAAAAGVGAAGESAREARGVRFADDVSSLAEAPMGPIVTSKSALRVAEKEGFRSALRKIDEGGADGGDDDDDAPVLGGSFVPRDGGALSSRDSSVRGSVSFAASSRRGSSSASASASAASSRRVSAASVRSSRYRRRRSRLREYMSNRPPDADSEDDTAAEAEAAAPVEEKSRYIRVWGSWDKVRRALLNYQPRSKSSIRLL